MPAKRTWKRWSADEGRYVLDAWKAGRKGEDLADELGRTVKSIWSFIRRIGAPGHKYVVGDNTRAAVQALWREGKSYSEIGRALGMTRNAAGGLCYRMGLVRKRPKHRPHNPAQPYRPGIDPRPAVLSR